MNPALALCHDAHDAGLVLFDAVGTGGNCFYNRMPDKPDTAVMVKDSGGDYLQDGKKLGYDMPVLQVLVRGSKDPTVGRDLAQSFYDRYHGMHGVTLDPDDEDVRLIDCTSQQSAPVHIGADESGRHLYSLNLALHIRNATSNRE